MDILVPLSAVEAWWGDSKTLVEHSVGFSHDALHVLAGPCIQLLTAAILRTSIRSPWPWFVVLLLELANEWHDLRAEHWPDPQMQWGEGVKDVILTMALPTLLLALGRFAPSLFGQRKRDER
ncbi:MAG TPA: hypothetical protein VEZ26_01200 [Sphingomonadaceae bacterium]|nr:hypothetical protein [Sphingomonadaceae bacterium]